MRYQWLVDLHIMTRHLSSIRKNKFLRLTITKWSRNSVKLRQVTSITSEIERRPLKTMMRQVRKRTTLHNSRLITRSINKLTMRQRATVVRIIIAPHRGSKRTIEEISEKEPQPHLLINRTKNLSAPSSTRLISSSSNTTRWAVIIQTPAAVYNEEPQIGNSKSLALVDQVF